MQIVINISEHVYTRLFDNGIQDNEIATDDICEMARSLRLGTPLPKGHGELIDRSKIHKAIYAEDDNCTGMGMTYEEMDAYNEGIDVMYSLVRGAKPIIEADGGGDDEVD